MASKRARSEDNTESNKKVSSEVDHWARLRVEKDPSTFEVKGICAAPHTPFTSDHKISTDVIPKIVDRLIRNGTHAAFVCGTTGEGLACTVAERKTVAEAWINAAKGKDFAILNHVGCESLYDTIELAKHSVSIGCKAIAVTPPTFFKPSNLEGLVGWLKAVSKAAPKMPLYYYHFNDMTGVNYPMNYLLASIAKEVPTFCGMKYTNYNFFEMERCIVFDGHHYNILLGREDVFPFLANRLCWEDSSQEINLLIKAYDSGDFEKAREHQKRCNDFASVIYYNQGKFGPGVGSIELVKAVMGMTGINVGPARLPRKEISKDALKLLKEDLEKIDFFSWCDK